MILFTMMTFIQFGLSLSIGPPSGDPIYSCPLQKDCIKISLNLVGPGNLRVRKSVNTIDVKNQQCQYEVCFRLNFGGSCVRHPTANIGHACLNTSEDNETGGIGHGYVECQIVEGGLNAVFSVYDGDGCEGSNKASMMIDSDTEATCEPRPEDITTCASNAVTGSDCMWTVQVPSCSDDPTPSPTALPKPSPTTLPTTTMLPIPSIFPSSTQFPSISSPPSQSSYPSQSLTPSSNPSISAYPSAEMFEYDDIQTYPFICIALPIVCDPYLEEILRVLFITLPFLITGLLSRMLR